MEFGRTLFSQHDELAELRQLLCLEFEHASELDLAAQLFKKGGDMSALMGSDDRAVLIDGLRLVTE